MEFVKFSLKDGHEWTLCFHYTDYPAAVQTVWPSTLLIFISLNMSRKVVLKDEMLENKAFELLFWEDELSSILDNSSDLQARIWYVMHVLKYFELWLATGFPCIWSRDGMLEDYKYSTASQFQGHMQLTIWYFLVYLIEENK